jgi:hypothetical protein
MELTKMTISEKEVIGVVLNSDGGKLVYLSEDGILVEIQSDEVTEKTVIKELTSKEELSIKAFLMIHREYFGAKTRISKFVENIYETEITKNDPLTLSHVQPILSNRAFKNLFLLQNTGTISVSVDGLIVIKDVSRPLEKQDAIILSRVLNVETLEVNVDEFLNRLEKALANEECEDDHIDETIEFLENLPSRVIEEVNNMGNIVGQLFSKFTTKKNSNDKESKETSTDKEKTEDTDIK